MSTITLHNESENQLKLIEALLKEMKIEFVVSEEEVIQLSNFEKELIDQGLEDVKNGRVISSEEAKRRAEECLK